MDALPTTYADTYVACADAGIHCVGCGKLLGTYGMAVEPGHEYDEWSLPEWPYPVEGCPVCAIREELGSLETNPKPWPKGKPRPLP